MISHIVATPRMSYYIEYSARVYNVYLKYATPEDIHVYSIDAVFTDAILAMYAPTSASSSATASAKALDELVKDGE